MRLLFAEDERDLNDIVCQKLRKEGYTVDACFDGAEALEFLAVADYDAVILDIMMPVMDGYAVLKQLRAEGRMTPLLTIQILGLVMTKHKKTAAGELQEDSIMEFEEVINERTEN